MPGSHLCIPRNETVISKTELQYNVLSPSSYTHIQYLREIFIFTGFVCLFCCRKICGPIMGIYKIAHRHMNVESRNWACAIPRKGIQKWDFRCSVWQLCLRPPSTSPSYLVFLVFAGIHFSCSPSECTQMQCQSSNLKETPPHPPPPNTAHGRAQI